MKEIDKYVLLEIKPLPKQAILKLVAFRGAFFQGGLFLGGLISVSH